MDLTSKSSVVGFQSVQEYWKCAEKNILNFNTFYEDIK